MHADYIVHAGERLHQRGLAGDADELVVALIGDPAVVGAQFGTQGLWLV